MNTQQNNNQEEFDFSFYFSAIVKHWALILFMLLLCIAGAVATNMLMQPRYKATVLMMIDRENSGKIEQTSISSWTSDEDYYRTQYKLLESQTLLEQVYKTLSLNEVPEFSKSWKQLQKAISIDPLPRSRLLNIVVSSYDPKLATIIANTLALNFTEQNLKNRLSMAKEVISALESTEKSQEEQELLNSLPQIVNSDFIKSLKQQETQIESNYANLSGKYTDSHPDIISLKKQLNAIRNTIDRETKRLLQSIKIELSGQFSANNVRIIDIAKVPEKPYQPKKAINLAIGFAVGLILGIIFALLAEFMDKTIKYTQEVEEKLNLSLLGFVPHEKQKKGEAEYQIMLKEGNVLTAENIRNIRTLLGFSLTAHKTKSFLIASALQGDGKSFVSTNLAAAYAQTNKKVLLIDGDLRRGRLHRTFKLSNEHGLSDLWTDPNNNAQQYIQQTKVNGLSVLTSGVRPPNSAELLNTPLLKEFIVKMQSIYDMVIIDCPAILPVADTLIWGQVINTSIFIVKQGKTNTKSALFAIERLQKAGIIIMGAVINNCRQGGIGYHEYGYYRSYYSDKK